MSRVDCRRWWRLFRMRRKRRPAARPMRYKVGREGYSGGQKYPRQIWLNATSFAFNLVVMKYPRYPIVTSQGHYMYEFHSEGPMGNIKKVVVYERIGKNVFNLGFGDWNEEQQKTSDSARSNNGDRDKVLVTVALTALDFTDRFPEAQIFIEGSSPSRTRLYQMGIANNLLEINQNFDVKGFYINDWEPFHSGRNYDAFLISRK